MESTILQLVVIVGAGIGAQWLAQLLRLPSIVFMLGAGVVVGPVLGWVDPDALLGDLLNPVISLAVAIILLEGGLGLRFRDIAEERGVILRLISVGAAITWGVGTIAALIFLDLPAEIAVLFGAILIVSGPTVVTPLLRQIRPHGASGRILKWEAILIDPIGAMVAVVVLEIILAREEAVVGGALSQVLVFIGIGLGIGIVAAFTMIPLLRWHVLPDRLHDSLTLAIAIVAFAISNELAKESGLLTVTVMGIILANQRWAEITHVRAFKENLVVLLLPAVFVILAARLDLARVAQIALPTLGVVAVLVLVGRPLAVWLSTTPSALELRQKAFLAWMAPRGVVAALVASVFVRDLNEAGIEGVQLLVPETFVVIGATALIYGVTSPWVARWLDLADSDPQGVLILGAGPVERRIAAALEAAEVRVVLAATSRAHEYEARMAGLTTHFGDLLGEESVDVLDLRGIGRVLAITQNHEFNSLAVLHFREDFGRNNTYQLYPESGTDTTGTDTMPGRPLFGSEATYEGLADRLIAGERIGSTTLTPNYPLAQLKEDRPDLLGLFVVRGHHVQVLTGRPFQARPGDRVIYLAAPAEAERPTEATQVDDAG